MKVARALCLVSLVSGGISLANPLPAEYCFTTRLLNSEKWEKITEATFDDHFCFHVKGFASDGEHTVEIAVYDASGREKVRVIAPVLAKGATWQRGFCPSTIPDVDAPGEWWFVVTLDDSPVISASLQVAYGNPRPKPGAAPKTPAPADPRARSR
jgi:hypothetical protein